MSSLRPRLLSVLLLVLGCASPVAAQSHQVHEYVGILYATDGEALYTVDTQHGYLTVVTPQLFLEEIVAGRVSSMAFDAKTAKLYGAAQVSAGANDYPQNPMWHLYEIDPTNGQAAPIMTVFRHTGSRAENQLRLGEREPLCFARQ